MMRFSDTVKLAYTKLRTRRLRLFISLFVASLLFGALMTGTIVVTGTLASVDSFSKEGFSNRYIIAGLDQSYPQNFSNDEALIARATELTNEEIAAKKATAKRLGVLYEETAEQALSRAVMTDPNSGEKFLNTTSPIAAKVIAESQKNKPNLPSMDKFKKQVDGAENYYKGVSRSGMRADQPQLILMNEGKEVDDKFNEGGIPSMGYGFSNYGSGLKAMIQDWNLMDNQLLEPFILPGQNLDIGDDGSIPIVASYSASQEVLKLPNLPVDASAKEKKQRLEDVRRGIAGKTFEICYRNATSNELYQQAIQQQQTIENNKGKKDFIKPDLVYKPSDIACSDPVIERDVRSAESKRYDEQMQKFEQEFGKQPSYSQVLKFRIVGVTQDSPYSSSVPGATAFDAMSIVNGIMASSLGTRWVSPISIEGSSVAVDDIFKEDISVYVFGGREAYFAEYSNAEAARDAFKNKTCRNSYGGPPMPGEDTSLPVCSKEGERSFYLMPFGSASLAIDDFRKGFRTFQAWAALIIGGIAAVILMGIIGRIIADARKETAVFRATGASRFMIAQIYIVYTIFLVLIMVAISLAIGLSLSFWIHSTYSSEASVNMALLFNVADLSKQFNFYGFDLYDIGLISLGVLVAAIVGASVPISSNIQRNPIKDMRNE